MDLFGTEPTAEVLRPRFVCLADLLFRRLKNEEENAPLLLGCLGWPSHRTLEVSLGQYRTVVLTLIARLAQRGVTPGQTVALVRLPRTSETLAALTYTALSVWGVRVLFPMYLEMEVVADWLRRSGASALLFSSDEVLGRDPTGHDAALLRQLRQTARSLGLPTFCFYRDLGLLDLLENEPQPGPDPATPAVQSLIQGTSVETECLLLTTSGTSGNAKLVRYAQGAFLRSCASWEQAGMFTPDRLGGRGLSLLLAHSMGLRALWNALWTRQPLCLITPEWFKERPERVSALLLKMQPEHITGGPATFYTLLEFARLYPGLKDECFRQLKCLVSSGAPFDLDLAKRVKAAFGVELANALGTTETMQVTSTLAPGSFPTVAPGEGALGNPLPGVRLRLTLDPALPDPLRRLEVQTPFGFSGYLEEPGQIPDRNPWLATGDLVVHRDGGLFYAGREQADFFSDGLGVKISRARLQAQYRAPPERFCWIGFFPLKEEPGLAALVFLSPRAGQKPQVVSDHHTQQQVGAFFESALEQMFDSLDGLEFRHLSVSRFAVVRAEPPRTVKGTVKEGEIVEQWTSLLDRLTGRYVKHPHIVWIDTERFARPAAVRLASPRMGELLSLLRLDRRFAEGRGDRLYEQTKEGAREVVDMVGGYGANLLGHRHPRVMSVATDFIDGGRVPLLDQAAARPEQGEVAKKLNLLVGRSTGGSYVARFGSTGAEAVEMALAHACLEHREKIRRIARDQKRRFGSRYPHEVRDIVTGLEQLRDSQSRTVLALQGAFHGHSLGARALLSNERKRKPFAAMSGIETVFLPVGDIDRLHQEIREHRDEVTILGERDGEVVEQVESVSRIIAAFAEPILGEGGIHEIPVSFLTALGQFEFPLVIDEIQTGLGRTGSFLASEGAHGDYYLFSKSLGGGVAKISVLLVERRRYLAELDEMYTSTFAGDRFSCAVASRVLEIVRREELPTRCRERGAALLERLRSVHQAYPDVVADVRGRGLMLGLELDPDAVADRFLLRAFARERLLGVLAGAYLLEEHAVRALPTLSAPNVLRFEPSAFVDDAALDQVARGLRALCEKLRHGDSAALFGFLVREEEAFSDPQPPEASLPEISTRIEPPADKASRVGFILHFVYPERELAMVEPSLRQLSPIARRVMAQKMMSLLRLKPVVSFGRNLFGGKIWLAAILVPADVAALESLHRMDYRFAETERLQEAVDLAANMGCTAVALGGYTSILARDGTAILPPPGVQVSSGNTFTAVVAARRIREACLQSGIRPEAPDSCAAIIGATGNIGSALTVKLASGGFQQLLLIGRDPHKLDELARLLRHQAPELRVETAQSIAAVQRCNVVAVATNTNEPLIYPEHLARDRPVVIADVSVPSAVSHHVQRQPNVQILALTGTVSLPGEPNFVISSHTPAGTVFCCTAEAILMGLEPETTADLALTGRIEPHSMDVLERLGERHGLFQQLGEGGFRPG